MATGRSGPSTREEQLEARIEDLTQTLGEAAVELRVREEVNGGQAGPSEDLEVIRVEPGISTTRSYQMLDIAEHSWRRWQSKARAGQPVKRPWPAPARDTHRDTVTAMAATHPAWGHRKIWAMVRHDEHPISQSTILRIMSEENLPLQS